MTAPPPSRANYQRWPVLIPIGYALFVTLYVALRYGYRWAEQDTSQFVTFSRTILSEGVLIPSTNAYGHGYGYQALSVVVMSVTGLDAAAIQLVVLPFLSLVVALVAFIAFRALTGNALVGGLASLVLFVQPEFVFSVQRGNHEKLTLTLVLTLVFLLTISLSRRVAFGTVAGMILTFYIGAWALIATNTFFASSFIGSIVLALGGGLVALWIADSPAGDRNIVRRLVYTVFACFVLLFAFVTYVYSPAEQNFRILRSLVDRLTLLFLTIEPGGTPYATTQAGWIGPWIYPLLTAFNWIILGASVAAWLWLARHFWRHGFRASLRNLQMLWLLAAAFGVQVVVAAAIDLSGFLGQNLQLRLFPLYMFFAIPLVLLAGWTLLQKRLSSPMQRTGVLVALAVLLAIFATTGILKATNDPLVSNKWLFFTQNEQRALAWTDSELEGQEVWIGFDERLREMQPIHQPPDPSQLNRYVLGQAHESTRYILLSDVIEDRGLRMRRHVPNTRFADRVYDNGGAQLYKRVPETRYQP